MTQPTATEPVPQELESTTGRPARGTLGFVWRGLAVFLSGGTLAVYLFGSWFAGTVLLAELVNSLQLIGVCGLWIGVFALWLAPSPCGPSAKRPCAAQCQMPCSTRKKSHWYRLYGGLVVAVACWGTVRVGAVWLPVPQPEPGPHPFRVMTFNMLGTNESHDEILAEIDRIAPDVFIIWELTYRSAKQLEGLRANYPHGLERPHYFETLGFGVYSKHPLTYQTVTWLPDRMLSCPIPELHIALGGHTVRILGIHASNPVHGETWGIRNRQLESLAQLVRSRTLPTIVMGDFNCTPWSPTMRRFLVESGLRDTRQGFGIHPTWPSFLLWFGVPIDHIMVTAEIHVHRRALGRPSHSDHVPVWCDLSVAEE